MTSALWHCSYADYNTVPTVIPGEGGAEDEIIPDTQQGSTVINRAAEFEYTYDFDEKESLEAVVRSGDACTFSFRNRVFGVTPTENENGYSLVEVKSLTSGNVKYYLVKINQFELRSFNSLQRLYNTADSLNGLILNTIARAEDVNDLLITYSYSAHNNNDYTPMTGTTENTADPAGLAGYILQKLVVRYGDYNFKGVEYFKTEVAEAQGDLSDSRTDKVVFDIDGDQGSSVLYFSHPGWNMNGYLLVAEFTCSDGNEWITLQQVGNTDVYRVMIPNGTSSVRFYRMFEEKYMVDGFEGAYGDYYDAATTYWTGFEAGDMFEVEQISDGVIYGDFVPFSL